MLSVQGSKCRSHTAGVRSPFLMNLMVISKDVCLFQSVLSGQLSSVGRTVVSLHFVIIQLTGSDEFKNVSKSSIFSKFILGTTLEKHSHFLQSSFILLFE